MAARAVGGDSLRRWARLAREKGWILLPTGSQHLRWITPDGRQTVTSSPRSSALESDQHTLRNICSELTALGLFEPGPTKEEKRTMAVLDVIKRKAVEQGWTFQERSVSGDESIIGWYAPDGRKIAETRFSEGRARNGAMRGTLVAMVREGFSLPQGYLDMYNVDPENLDRTKVGLENSVYAGRVNGNGHAPEVTQFSLVPEAEATPPESTIVFEPVAVEGEGTTTTEPAAKPGERANTPEPAPNPVESTIAAEDGLTLREVAESVEVVVQLIHEVAEQLVAFKHEIQREIADDRKSVDARFEAVASMIDGLDPIARMRRKLAMSGGG